MTHPRRWLALPALLVAAFALVACAGDDAPEGDATAAATTEGTSAATATPTEAPFQLASPEELDGYRYAVVVTLSPEALETADAPAGLPLDDDFTIEITGEVLNPDREHSMTVVNLGFLSLNTETIRIGDDEWARQGRAAWQPATAESDLSSFLGDANFSPTSIFASGEGASSFNALSNRLADHEFEVETVNGVEARHYSFTQEEFYEIFQAEREMIPSEVQNSDLTAELWVAEEERVPVRMVILGVAEDGTEIMRVEMDVTDIDGDIEIEPPI